MCSPQRIGVGVVFTGMVFLVFAFPGIFSLERTLLIVAGLSLSTWIAILFRHPRERTVLVLVPTLRPYAAMFFGGALLSWIWSAGFSAKSVLLATAPLLVVGIGGWVGQRQKLVQDLRAVLLLAGGGAGAHAVLQFFQPDLFSFGVHSGVRPASLFENPNHLGSFLALLLPLAICIFLGARTHGPRVGAYAVVGLIYSGLVVTASRGAWCSAVAGCLILSTGYYSQVRRGFLEFRPKRIGALMGLLVAITAALSTKPVSYTPDKPPSSSVGRILSSTTILGSGAKTDFSISHRQYIWQVTREIIRAHPVIGNGHGEYPKRFREIRERWLQERAVLGTGWTDAHDTPYAHNEYLHVWAESGLLGLAGFLGLILVPVIHAARVGLSCRRECLMLWGALGLLTTVLVDSLVSYPLHLPLSSSVFWLTIGIVAAPAPREESARLETLLVARPSP